MPQKISASSALKNSSQARLRVGLLIESSRGYGRGLLEGIAGYLRDHGNWSVFFQERRRGDPSPEWLSGWKGHGIIARVDDRRLARAIEKLNVPAIDVRGLLPLNMPLVATDDQAVAHLALDHLLERGFHRFGFCGFQGANYSDTRCSFFVEKLTRLGHRCSVFTPGKPVRVSREYGFEQHGVARMREIAVWLRTLTPPIAIMACNDVCGQQVLDACRDIGLSVPGEIAVIGVDNDEILCELSDPPLSSIRPDTQHIGFIAAEMLDGMMRRRVSRKMKTVVPPAGVVTRRSTDVLAFEDREIAETMRFIREHVCEGINVADLVAQTSMSRSLFERRFKQAVGRTPNDEIIAIRLQRVKDMLAATDLPSRAISTKAGFPHQEYMFSQFKRLTGMTPGQYRKRSRL